MSPRVEVFELVTKGRWPTAVADLGSGRGSARRLAQRIEALVAGDADPGWSRLPWRRG